jgi:hypothetical protein
MTEKQNKLEAELADIFDDFEQERDLDAVRPNYAVAKCCGNCKYYKYYMGNQRRGLCLVEIHRAGKSVQKEIPHTRQHFKDARDSGKYAKTHVTCTCDNHALTGVITALDKVGDYCGETLKLKGDY